MRAERGVESRGRAYLELTFPGLAALAVAYFVLSIAVWQLADPEYVGAPWWPAADLTLGVMCVAAPKQWPAIAAAVFIGDLAADFVQSTPIATSLTWAFANTIEPVLGAAALRFFFGGLRPNFDTPENVGRFFAVAALAGTPVASAIGSLASAITYDLEWLITWRDWYIGDVLGILVVAPTVFYASRIRREFNPRIAIALALVIGLSFAVFWTDDTSALLRPYLLTPLLAVTALSFGTAGAVPAALLMAVIANIGGALGHGPYAQTEVNDTALIELQTFTAIQLLTTYLLVGLRTQLLMTSSRMAVLRPRPTRLADGRRQSRSAAACSRGRDSSASDDRGVLLRGDLHRSRRFQTDQRRIRPRGRRPGSSSRRQTNRGDRSQLGHGRAAGRGRFRDRLSRNFGR